jgi:hypothetical protein
MRKKRPDAKFHQHLAERISIPAIKFQILRRLMLSRSDSIHIDLGHPRGTWQSIVSPMDDRNVYFVKNLLF